MTTYEVEVIQYGHYSMLGLNLKSPYSLGVVAKPYPIEYVSLQFQKFDGLKENSHEYITRFIFYRGFHL